MICRPTLARPRRIASCTACATPPATPRATPPATLRATPTPPHILNQYASLSKSVNLVLRTADFRADVVLRDNADARVFYDAGHRGLRLIAVTAHLWAEAWSHGPGRRRASLHTAALDRGIVVEFDDHTGATTIIKNDGWPADMLDFVYEPCEQ